MKNPTPCGGIEIFFSSKDLFNHGSIITDSLRDFKYVDVQKDKFIISYNHKTISLPIDSVWGYKLLGGTYVTRLKTGWGRLSIIQYDKMAIYVYSLGKNHLTYFSESLDSPVIILTIGDLKAYFRNNKIFLQLLKKEKSINWFNTATVVDKKTGKYKVIEVYKKSLEMNAALNNK